MIVCLQTWSLRMRIVTFRLHNAGLLQAMRSIECASPIYCCARLWLDGIPCLESDLNFVQGSFKEHFRRKKKTQKHNAKLVFHLRGSKNDDFANNGLIEKRWQTAWRLFWKVQEELFHLVQRVDHSAQHTRHTDSHCSLQSGCRFQVQRRPQWTFWLSAWCS